jgi:hypothetical protein
MLRATAGMPSSAKFLHDNGRKIVLPTTRISRRPVTAAGPFRFYTEFPVLLAKKRFQPTTNARYMAKSSKPCQRCKVVLEIYRKLA